MIFAGQQNSTEMVLFSSRGRKYWCFRCCMYDVLMSNCPIGISEGVARMVSNCPIGIPERVARMEMGSAGGVRWRVQSMHGREGGEVRWHGLV